MSARQRYFHLMVTVGLVTGGLAFRGGGSARANGAFPDSESILLPTERPKAIILGTTFGLVFSEDDGASWRYSCESRDTPLLRQYQLGAPPDNRIYGLSDAGIPVSADGACSWTFGGGALVSAMALDVFADPIDPLRVFALARSTGGAAGDSASAYQSGDGGLTYTGPIFTAPPDDVVTGIESAASSPGTVYITYYAYDPGTGTVHPRLATSLDGGATWTSTDIEAGVGAVVPLLAAVDATDSRKVYLRIVSGPVTAVTFEGLAVTTDAGATWAVPLLEMGGSVTGLARLPGGTLVASGTLARTSPTAEPPPAVFRSEDGGQTFVTEVPGLHPGGLAQRNGVLFAATKNFQDGFALASSDDAGRTWRPRMAFHDIAGIKECVFSSCQDSCDLELAGIAFPPEVCNPVSPKPPRKTGCGCALGGGEEDDGSGAATFCGGILAVIGWVVARHRGR